jgi:hypothetical protein
LRRPAGGVEVDCLTPLAGEATLDTVALYDGPKVLDKVNCWIVEAGIVDRNNSASIVNKRCSALVTMSPARPPGFRWGARRIW